MKKLLGGLWSRKIWRDQYQSLHYNRLMKRNFPMMKLESVVLSLALLLFGAAPAVAQLEELKALTPEERSGMLTKMMQSSLTLDEKATASVSAINLKYAREAQIIMDSSNPKFKKLMTFRENSKAKDAELKGVLTPEQFSQYEQKKSEIQETVKQKLIEKSQAKQ